MRFEVIDPPSVRLEPVAPDRPRLLALVLFAGLLAGLGVALPRAQLRPDVHQLARRWRRDGLAGARRRRAHLGRPLPCGAAHAADATVAAATGALVLLFAVVLVFQDSGANVLQTLIRRA